MTQQAEGRPVGEKSVFDVLTWEDVKEHYLERRKIHDRLRKLHADKKAIPFARLLVGISDIHGNYSARDHNLGPKILDQNPRAPQRLYDLAERFLTLENVHDVPQTIRNAGLKYFQIGVGSEASCLLNPQVCWIANTRSIWTHLVFKHKGDTGRANEELKLYRNGEETSEMAYRMWSGIHREMGDHLVDIIQEARKFADMASVKPGKLKYIWADAIANALYAYHHD
ncbi:hypothetical protein [Rhodopila sp.]|uniref:hypothetical protein n=1 Tax=Rhodopila sp. TaxID=2480087 RepID=UPI003D0C77F4